MKQTCSPTRWLALLVLLLLASPLSSAVQGQASQKVLTKSQIIELLEGGVPVPRVTALVRERGVSFELTRQAESQLREAGATDELLKIIRQRAPRPAAGSTHSASPSTASPSAAPPVLLIEVTPGGAQAYVDDEPAGTTSSEGRLKLSHLSPGQHTVRLSHFGYRDYEKNVQLTPGQAAKVTAALEVVKAPIGTTSAGAVNNPNVPAAGPVAGRAYLGVQLAADQPPGIRGAVVSGAEPGGPADRAGLRAYHVIQRVGGEEVTSREGLQQIIARHHAGDTVDITFYDGSRTVTSRVQLASVPAGAFSPTPQPSGTAASGSASQTRPPILSDRGQGGTVPPPGNLNGAQFFVYHDHGNPPPTTNFCVGLMTIGSRVIQYRSTTGVHSFDIPVEDVKEAKKNGVYLVNIGGFHIRPRRGNVYNFVVINPGGQFLPPDSLLMALGRALGTR